jgi:intein/homing endonuclease
LNYARPFIKYLVKYTSPLYSKTSFKGQKFFNKSNIEQVKKIKKLIKDLPSLEIQLRKNHLIIEINASNLGWAAILLKKSNQFSEKKKYRTSM